jgi:hypothetical protein
MRTLWMGCGTTLVVLVVLAADVAQAQEKPAANEITLIGCVELERDYRARKESGKGGVLGSGVGVGNEFVLSNARPIAAPGRGRSGAVSTSAPAVDYSLTGRLERDLLRAVNRQVEVVGVVEPGKDGELQTVQISLWHPVSDFCPNK